LYAYKQLISTQVLAVEGSLSFGRDVRTYAYCGTSPDTVAIVILNVNASSSNTVELERSFAEALQTWYSFTGFPTSTVRYINASVWFNTNFEVFGKDLSVGQVALNGQVMTLQNDHQLPTLTGSCHLLCADCGKLQEVMCKACYNRGGV
jgi:hypothetical protein